MSQRILLPLPALGYECTEATVPWRVLTQAGHQITFATPDGKPATADMTTVDGTGLGLLGYIFRAAKAVRGYHAEMVRSADYQAPIRWDAIDPVDFDAVVVPGGHHNEMRPFLDSTELHATLAAFSEQNKLVAAICHGVLLVARSKQLDGRSIVAGRHVTTVPGDAENQVHKLCSARMGHERYGKPYDLTAEEEVRELMHGEGQLTIVKMPFRHDASGRETGLCIVDEHVVTARMPHDSWTFAKTVVDQLAERAGAANRSAVRATV